MAYKYKPAGRLRQAITGMRFRRPLQIQTPGTFQKNTRGEVILVETSKSPSRTDRNQNYHRGEANTFYNLKILT